MYASLIFDSLANNFCPGRNALRAEGECIVLQEEKQL